MKSQAIMDVIAFIFALVAFVTAAASASKVKVLEKQIALIRRHVKFSDIDMLSPETKALIGQAEKKEIIAAIRQELGISNEDAEALIQRIEGEAK